MCASLMMVPFVRAVSCGLLLIFLQCNAFAAEDSDLWQYSAAPELAQQLTLVRDTPVPVATISAGKYYRILERQVFYENKTLSEYRRYAYEIVNNSGLESGADISIEFNPVHQRLLLHRVVVHRDEQSIDQSQRARVSLLQREQQLEQGLYNGEQTLHLILHDVRVGDVIEYSYSKVGENPVFADHVFGWQSLQFSVPIEQLYFRLRVPHEHTIHYRHYGPPVASPRIIRDGEFQDYVWQFRDVPAQQYESNTPDWYIARSVVQYTDFSSWQELREWAQPLYQIPDSDAFSAELAAKVEELKKLEDIPRQQVEEALSFVQNDIRYTGIEIGVNNYQPRPPNQVVEQRYGDCKDKSLLLVTLLEQIGFKAYPALVSSTSRGAIADYLPAPDVFDHMIVKVDYFGSDYWLDPTRTQQATRIFDVAQADFRAAMTISEQSNEPELYTIKDSGTPNKEIHEMFVLSGNTALASTRYRVTSYYYGAYGERMRQHLQEKAQENLEKDYIAYYNRLFPGIQTAKPMEVTDQRDLDLLKIHEEYDIPQVWTKTKVGDKSNVYNFSLDLKADVFDDALQLPAEAERKQPLALSYPLRLVQEIRLWNLHGWEIEDEHESVTNSAFDFSRDISVDGRHLILKFRYHSKQPDIKLAQMQQYLADLNKARELVYYAVQYDDYETPVDRLTRKAADNISDWFSNSLEQLQKSAESQQEQTTTGEAQ